MAMNLFSAPSWDVDATSESTNNQNAPGRSVLLKRKRKGKKQAKKISDTLNSPPSEEKQSNQSGSMFGGILKKAKKALGVLTSTHEETETTGSNDAPALSEGSLLRVKKKRRKPRSWQKKQLIKSSENSNAADNQVDMLVQPGTEKIDEEKALPASKKISKRRRKKLKAVGQDPSNNHLIKLNKFFEVVKKREKATKARNGEESNPSATDELEGPDLSSTQFNVRKEQIALKNKLKNLKRRERVKAKKREQQEEQKRNTEVILNSSQKKKMLRVAEESGLLKGSEEGTTNSSYDNSFSESLPAEGDNDNTGSPMNKKKRKKNKKKKKKGTDVIDGNVVSASNNFEPNSNNTSSKKEVVPLAVEYGDKVQKSVKRKMIVSKLMNQSEPNADVSAALESGSKSKRSKRKKRKAAAVELLQEQPQNEDKNTLHNLKKKRLSEKEPSLRERVSEQLKSARFRWINEQLYSSNSWEAVQFFKEDPEAFQAYHAGYRNQVAQWPVNPLDVLIQSISRLPAGSVVADFGCGEALLAKSLPNMKVHSLDLVAQTPEVVACDMAHTPLLMESVDVAVFCLSLMGTNLNDFILEANRVLRNSGMLMIAEVESRFEDIDNFTSAMVHFGFNLKKKDLSNQMFIFMEFQKTRKVSKTGKLPTLSLDPCIYKKR